jgi:hypothetical protein
MALTWYRLFQKNGGLNQILRRQTSRFHYGLKVPIGTIAVFFNHTGTSQRSEVNYLSYANSQSFF